MLLNGKFWRIIAKEELKRQEKSPNALKKSFGFFNLKLPIVSLFFLVFFLLFLCNFFNKKGFTDYASEMEEIKEIISKKNGS